jgi:hypothetical protein
MNLKSRTTRFAITGLALVLCGSAAGSASAGDLPVLPKLPQFDIPVVPPVVPPVVIDPKSTNVIIKAVDQTQIALAFFPHSAAFTIPAGAVERSANYSYSFAVSTNANASPAPIDIVHVVPSTVTGAVWRCSLNTGPSCGTGSGNIAMSWASVKSASATFTVSGVVAPTATDFPLSVSATRLGYTSSGAGNVKVNVPVTTLAPVPTTAAPVVTTVAPPAPAPIVVAPTPATNPPAAPVVSSPPAPAAQPAPTQPPVINITIVNPEAQKSSTATKKKAKRVVRSKAKSSRKAKK